MHLEEVKKAPVNDKLIEIVEMRKENEILEDEITHVGNQIMSAGKDVRRLDELLNILLMGLQYNDTHDERLAVINTGFSDIHELQITYNKAVKQRKRLENKKDKLEGMYWKNINRIRTLHDSISNRYEANKITWGV